MTDADDALVPMEHNTTAVIWITICAKFDALKKCMQSIVYFIETKIVGTD